MALNVIDIFQYRGSEFLSIRTALRRSIYYLFSVTFSVLGLNIRGDEISRNFGQLVFFLVIINHSDLFVYLFCSYLFSCSAALCGEINVGTITVCGASKTYTQRVPVNSSQPKIA